MMLDSLPFGLEPVARILHGDNLPLLRELCAELGPTVTLAYLDPPYLTQRDWKTSSGELAYSDRWATMDDYLDHLRLRLEAIRDLLAPEGCCVVHVDWRTSGYVRVLGDEVFGRDNFASDIVWRYRRWPSKTKNFQRVHDVLLRWVRTPGGGTWNQLYEPLAPSTVKHWGTRRQRADVDAEGRRKRSSSTSEPSPGVPLGDVWDLPIIAPRARERTGYPTQKPEALLERLIAACTNEGDLVLDPYLGSGTTAAVAVKLGRQTIGIDASRIAVETTTARLAA